jgi:putative transposase
MMNESHFSNPRKDMQSRREVVLRDVLGKVEGKLSQHVIDELKKDLGVSRATAYRMIKTFRSCGAIVAPTTRPVGRPKGARVLDARREAIIQETIRGFYLPEPHPRFSELVGEIGRRCREEHLPAPNWRTIKSRVVAAVAQSRNGAQTG